MYGYLYIKMKRQNIFFDEVNMKKYVELGMVGRKRTVEDGNAGR